MHASPAGSSGRAGPRVLHMAPFDALSARSVDPDGIRIGSAAPRSLDAPAAAYQSSIGCSHAEMAMAHRIWHAEKIVMLCCSSSRRKTNLQPKFVQ